MTSREFIWPARELLWSDAACRACSIGEAVVYAGAAVAEIAAGNLAYATTHYGVSWCVPGPAHPQL